MEMRFKGQLGDGHVHLTAEEYLYHRQRENHEKQKQKLRKLANNPAFSEEVRETLYLQIFYINLLEFYQQEAMMQRGGR